MPSEPGDYRYPIPTASIYADIDQWIPLVSTALLDAFDSDYVWEDDDPDRTARSYVQDAIVFMSELPFMMFPIGAVCIWLRPDIPEHFLILRGQSLAIADYPELFAIFGHAYGGGGTDEFNIPDMRDRTFVGAIQAGGGSFGLSSTGGEINHTLTVDELPAHNHEVSARDNATAGTGARVMRAAGAESNKLLTEQTGSNQPHNNMPPYRAAHWVVRAR